MEGELTARRGFLNRDVIKYIAMATMLLNHVANIFLIPGTFLFTLFVNIGYFTAVTMCYFMVEGYNYTHSKKRYALRLLIFSGISEVPFCLAFTKYGVMQFQGMNMIWTLFLCFLVNLTMEKIKKPWLKVLILIGLIWASSVSDWPYMATLFTIFFIWARGSKKRKVIAYAAAMLAYAAFEILNAYGWYSPCEILRSAVYGMIAIACSGICILCFYNGKRIERGRTFSKWFFYIFYPAHLLILGWIRISMMR